MTNEVKRLIERINAYKEKRRTFFEKIEKEEERIGRKLKKSSYYGRWFYGEIKSCDRAIERLRGQLKEKIRG